MALCINPQCQRPQNSDQTSFCQTCGSELTLEGRYRVMSELGSGGFGKTYEVVSSQASDLRVLKVLINPMPKAVELFQREAEVLAKLHHSGIPRVESDGYFVYFPRNCTEPLHCLIMEKIEGLNLQDYMKQRGSRPVNQKLVLQWLIEIVKILEIVHSQHFFHRDIKPSNIMLRNDGRLALIDFGTAREVTGTYVAKQEIQGVTGIISTGYTPIEQLNGQAVQQSDFYALGRTIVYLLTAQEPSQIYLPITDEFPWQQFVPQVHSEFAHFLDQMMARIPRDRPQNTQVILQSLARIYQMIQTQDPISNPGSSQPYLRESASPQSRQAPSVSKGAYPRSDLPSRTPLPSSGTTPQSAPANSTPYSSAPLGFQVSEPQAWGSLSDVASGIPLGSFTLGADQSVQPQNVRYGNLGSRAIAALIDLFLLGFVSLVLSLMIGIVTEEIHGQGVGYATGYALGVIIVCVLPVMTWLYFAVLESSKKQATWGKQMMGLKVTTLQMQSMSFGRATLRFVCKLFSMVLLIGCPLALLLKRKQALHDVVARTVVIHFDVLTH